MTERKNLNCLGDGRKIIKKICVSTWIVNLGKYIKQLDYMVWKQTIICVYIFYATCYSVSFSPILNYIFFQFPQLWLQSIKIIVTIFNKFTDSTGVYTLILLNKMKKIPGDHSPSILTVTW